MAEFNFRSDTIQVFPSTKRTDTYDRGARLYTEYNITSLVNRLVSRDSFIIEGLGFNSVGNTLLKGSCNIYGYLFNIHENIILTETDVDPLTASGDLYFKIVLEDTSINTSTSLGDVNINFTELSGQDDNESDSTYFGISLITSSTELGDTGNAYYLKIASLGNYTDGGNTTKGWVLDETARLKFDCSDLFLTRSNTSSPIDASLDNRSCLTGNISLYDWLNSNFIIDDGEI